jgi:hypothetical protein
MTNLIDITTMTDRELDALLGIKRIPKFRMPKRGKHTVTRIRK